MISLEKWMILTPSQKLTTNVGDLGKIIVYKYFEWLPKVQKIAQSGHTVDGPSIAHFQWSKLFIFWWPFLWPFSAQDSSIGILDIRDRLT